MRAALLALVALSLAACTAKPSDRLSIRLTNYDALPGWQQAGHAEALQTFRRSCEKMMAKKPGAKIGQGTLEADREDWDRVCELAEQVPASHARDYFERNFTPFTAGNDGKTEGLFTGYFEPLLEASDKPRPGYVPIYGLPDDIIPKKEYFSRKEIDEGALKGRGLEIAYAKDPVALFFAQIQGSAQLKMDNGKIRRIGYAGKNNQAYIAIGKILADEGEIPREQVNMFSIREWMARHPERAKQLMWQNPSYVFFRELPGTKQPLGAQQAELTPWRSLAVDYRFIPYGMPLFLDTELPETAHEPVRPFRRLMVAQDTGGAIRGPVRGDIFFGAGNAAAQNAGHMKGKGGYALLIPNSLAARLRW